MTLPRIARFLPAGSMLEIAPGQGRWTSYLREHCKALAIVDLDTARRLIDCLSTFTSPSSRWARPNRVFENSGFVAEARAVKRRAPLYSP